jgi:S-adenosylmethionine:tRNA ribosyltransferase-isomerase
LRLSDFDFELPPELIAQAPGAERAGSRLLRVGREELADLRIRDLPGLLRPGDLLVMNDTRVIKARLLGRKAPTGGQVEALVERVVGERQALTLLRASKATRPGARLQFGGAQASVLARHGDFFTLEFDQPVLEVLEREGRTPLPPYIERAAGALDDERYQTVYARAPGAVAAPTAGLHFDEALMDAVRAAGARIAFVTLHVGVGTFQPVRHEDLEQHRMHEERYEIPQATCAAIAGARREGGRLIAVGTTSLRTLETAALDDGSVPACTGETKLFITPGYRFRAADALLTNFHLPKSTLMMLVSAFAGVRRIRRAYAHAIERRYRFFSYGDAMLLERCENALEE